MTQFWPDDESATKVSNSISATGYEPEVNVDDDADWFGAPLTDSAD